MRAVGLAGAAYFYVPHPLALAVFGYLARSRGRRWSIQCYREVRL